MGEPNPDRMIDDEDLEDGEIETDEENEAVTIVEDTKQIKHISFDKSDSKKEPATKKSKCSDDESKKSVETKSTKAKSVKTDGKDEKEIKGKI